MVTVGLARGASVIPGVISGNAPGSTLAEQAGTMESKESQRMITMLLEETNQIIECYPSKNDLSMYCSHEDTMSLMF